MTTNIPSATKKYFAKVPEQVVIPPKTNGCVRSLYTADWHLGVDPRNTRIQDMPNMHLQVEVESTNLHKVNIRQDDVDQRAIELMNAAVAHQVDVILNAGDFYDKPSFPDPYVTTQGQRIVKMGSDAGIKHVIILGNHDFPPMLKDAELAKLALLPHVFVTEKGFYKKVKFPEYNLVVHCVPHSYTKEVVREELEYAKTQTEPECYNVLVWHGGVTSVEFYSKNSDNGVVFELDELMHEGFDLVLSGDYHKAVEYLPTEPGKPMVFYPGPIERHGMGEVSNQPRFYIKDIDTKTKEVVGSYPVYLNVRPMIDLPILDVKGMTVEEVMEAFLSRVDEVELEGAIVRQRVRYITDEVRKLLDMNVLDEQTKDALHFEWKFIDKIYPTEEVQVEEEEFEDYTGYHKLYMEQLEHTGEYSVEKFNVESLRILEEATHDFIGSDRA